MIYVRIGRCTLYEGQLFRCRAKIVEYRRDFLEGGVLPMWPSKKWRASFRMRIAIGRRNCKRIYIGCRRLRSKWVDLTSRYVQG